MSSHGSSLLVWMSITILIFLVSVSQTEFDDIQRVYKVNNDPVDRQRDSDVENLEDEPNKITFTTVYGAIFYVSLAGLILMIGVLWVLEEYIKLSDSQQVHRLLDCERSELEQTDCTFDRTEYLVLTPRTLFDDDFSPEGPSVSIL